MIIIYLCIYIASILLHLASHRFDTRSFLALVNELLQAASFNKGACTVFLVYSLEIYQLNCSSVYFTFSVHAYPFKYRATSDIVCISDYGCVILHVRARREM